MIWRMYFDPSYPSVAQIQDRFRDKFIDLNRFNGLTSRDLADAFLNRKSGYGLIIPRSYQFWDKSETWKNFKNDEIKLSSALKFNKFGPEANLNRSNMTIREANENNFLPIPAILEAARGMDIDISYRGFGYWGIREKKHRLIPFDVLTKGYAFYRTHGYDIKIDYQHGDPHCSAPSASRKDKRYHILLRPTPTTNEPNILWTDMHGDCGCEDSMFREDRSKYKTLESDIFHDTFKYSKDEFVWCKHTYACYRKAVEESKKLGKSLICVDMFPFNHVLMNAWMTLENYTIIADGNGEHAVRPSETKIRIALGKIISYDPERTLAYRVH
jgi:hypothetical protein